MRETVEELREDGSLLFFSCGRESEVSKVGECLGGKQTLD